VDDPRRRPVVPFFRELAEMRYLWREPVRIADSRLPEALGREPPHTQWTEAVRITLEGLGCLPRLDQRRS
jgi:hypothetical protein